MKNIYFNEISKNPGKITLNLIIKENNKTIKNEELFFKFNIPFKPSDDILAIVLSTICGSKMYKNIYLDLNITSSIYINIKSFTNSNVFPKEILENKESKIEKENFLLNFSGGIDSLALLSLLPKNYTKLVSINWGGSFREYDFFKKFDTYIVETNLLDLGIKYNWSALGMASIFYSEYLKGKYVTFGNVLEASAFTFSPQIPDKYFKTPEAVPFCYINDISYPYYTVGLTEVGTFLVASYYFPELIGESLESICHPTWEKRGRKELLLEIINKKFIRNIEHEKSNPPWNKFKFGDVLSEDFLCLYIIKHLGIEKASQILMDIPEEAEIFSKKYSLDFYERFNTNFLLTIPKEYRGEMVKRLINADVIPYNQNDYNELQQVVNFLSKYHEELKKYVL